MQFLVTGGGSGIGEALTKNLVDLGHDVLICGRRVSHLEKVAAYNLQRINIVVGDLTQEATIDNLVNALKGRTLDGLVQNAAQLAPLGTLSSISMDDFRAHQKMNVDVPLTLFQSLQPFLEGARVLHVSSLAAHKPFPRWGAYCMSKAALYMMYEMLKQECTTIHFGSVMPGITNTAMQEKIRTSSTLDNEDKAFFVGLFESNRLLEPSVVGQFLTWLLLETSTQQFSSKEWDIYDTSHHDLWLKSGEVKELNVGS